MEERDLRKKSKEKTFLRKLFSTGEKNVEYEQI